MNTLSITNTQVTPTILFDAGSGKFDISGNSLPEDVMLFYGPVIKWLNEYVQNPAPFTSLSFKLNYFNTASSKIILEILNIIETIVKNGNKAEVNWCTLEVDEDMLESGKEYESLVSIPFNFLTYMPS